MSNEKREYWSKLIAEHEGSGQTIRAFCKERGIADHCFYFWRKRLGLGRSEPVQFPLLKAVAGSAPLELLLASAGLRYYTRDSLRSSIILADTRIASAAANCIRTNGVAVEHTVSSICC